MAALAARGAGIDAFALVCVKLLVCGFAHGLGERALRWDIRVDAFAFVGIEFIIGTKTDFFV